MKNIKFIIVTAILIFAAVIALALYLPSRLEKSSALMANFPKEIGDWKAEDIKLDERTFEILETRNLIMRNYKNSAGEEIYLYIVYSEQNRKVTHPPEICYSGGGATIVQKSITQLTPAVKANKMVIEEPKTRQIVFYWFKAGKMYTYNYFKQQIKIVTDLLTGKKTSSAMIRISTISKDNNDGKAIELLKNFAKKIQPLTDKYVP